MSTSRTVHNGKIKANDIGLDHTTACVRVCVCVCVCVSACRFHTFVTTIRDVVYLKPISFDVQCDILVNRCQQYELALSIAVSGGWRWEGGGGVGEC